MLLLYHLDYNNFHCCKHMSQGWESYHRQSLYKWLYSLFLYSKVFQYHYLHVWLDELRSSGTATWQITDLLQQWLRTTQKKFFFEMSVASWCSVLCCSVCWFSYGSFRYGALKLEYQHCLQHSLFEHLFNVYWQNITLFFTLSMYTIKALSITILYTQQQKYTLNEHLMNTGFLINILQFKV